MAESRDTPSDGGSGGGGGGEQPNPIFASLATSLSAAIAAADSLSRAGRQTVFTQREQEARDRAHRSRAAQREDPLLLAQREQERLFSAHQEARQNECNLHEQYLHVRDDLTLPLKSREDAYAAYLAAKIKAGQEEEAYTKFTRKHPELPRRSCAYDAILEGTLQDFHARASHGPQGVAGPASMPAFTLKYWQLPREWNTVVGVLGLFNKGKTWFLSRLGMTMLPSEGFATHTTGLCFKFCHPPKLPAFVVVDSEGKQAPLSMELLISKPAGSDAAGPQADGVNPFAAGQRLLRQQEQEERFREELILKLADVAIIVVNDITAPEQQFILQVAEARFNRASSNCDVIVVHNLRGLEGSHDEARKQFDCVVQKIFGLYPRSKRHNPEEEDGVPWIQTCFGPEGLAATDGGTLRHVFLKQESFRDDESGDNIRFNDKTFELIRSWITSRSGPQKWNAAAPPAGAEATPSSPEDRVRACFFPIMEALSCNLPSFVENAGRLSLAEDRDVAVAGAEPSTGAVHAMRLRENDRREPTPMGRCIISVTKRDSQARMRLYNPYDESAVRDSFRFKPQARLYMEPPPSGDLVIELEVQGLKRDIVCEVLDGRHGEVQISGQLSETFRTHRMLREEGCVVKINELERDDFSRSFPVDAGQFDIHHPRPPTLNAAGFLSVRYPRHSSTRMQFTITPEATVSAGEASAQPTAEDAHRKGLERANTAGGKQG